MERNRLLDAGIAAGLAGAAASLASDALAWAAPVGLGVLAGIAAYGSQDMASGVFGRAFVQGSANAGAVALTFDDGPDPTYTPRVLETLARHGARATFFVVGRRARANPSICRALTEAGHELGLHSYFHDDLYPLRAHASLRRDLRVCARLVRKTTGASPVWFRPPNAILNPRICFEAARAGLRLAGFSVRPRDGVALATDVLVSRVVPGLRSGAVVLLHDARPPVHGQRVPPVVEGLDAILTAAHARGLACVTLSELERRSRGVA